MSKMSETRPNINNSVKLNKSNLKRISSSELNLRNLIKQATSTVQIHSRDVEQIPTIKVVSAETKSSYTKLHLPGAKIPSLLEVSSSKHELNIDASPITPGLSEVEHSPNASDWIARSVSPVPVKSKMDFGSVNSQTSKPGIAMSTRITNRTGQNDYVSTIIRKHGFLDTDPLSISIVGMLRFIHIIVTTHVGNNSPRTMSLKTIGFDSDPDIALIPYILGFLELCHKNNANIIIRVFIGLLRFTILHRTILLDAKTLKWIWGASFFCALKKVYSNDQKIKLSKFCVIAHFPNPSVLAKVEKIFLNTGTKYITQKDFLNIDNSEIDNVIDVLQKDFYIHEIARLLDKMINWKYNNGHVLSAVEANKRLPSNPFDTNKCKSLFGRSHALCSFELLIKHLRYEDAIPINPEQWIVPSQLCLQSIDEGGSPAVQREEISLSIIEAINPFCIETSDLLLQQETYYEKQLAQSRENEENKLTTNDKICNHIQKSHIVAQVNNCPINSNSNQLQTGDRKSMENTSANFSPNTNNSGTKLQVI